MAMNRAVRSEMGIPSDGFRNNQNILFNRWHGGTTKLFKYNDSSDKEMIPSKVISKIILLNPEEDYDWEDPGIIPIDSGGYNCDGCKYGHLNQVGHMGPGGCMEEKYEDYCINCGHIIPDITEAQFSLNESIYICEACEA